MQLKLPPLLMPFFVMVFCFSASLVNGQATVTSDKDDYAPRSNAVFTGSGFQAFETVVLKVKNLDRACNTVSADSSYLPWSVTADANGGFVANWLVCDCLGDSLRLKAQGQTSGLIAYAYFTDGRSDYTSTISTSNVCSGTSFTLTLKNISNSTQTGVNSNREFNSFLIKIPNGVTVTSSVNLLGWNLNTSIPGEIRYSTASNPIPSGFSIIVTLKVSAVNQVNSTWETRVFSSNNWTVPTGNNSPEFVLTNNSNVPISPVVYPSNTITEAPSISPTGHPQGATKNVGESVTFNVGASGSNLTYQWRKNGSNINGATQNSYSINNLAIDDAGNYDVVVSGSCSPAVTSQAATLEVKKLTQSITFNSLDNKTYGDAAFHLNATASSGLAVKYSIIDGSSFASISGNTVTITGAGNVTIRASQDGNENYNAAPAVEQSFEVAKADQVISWATPSAITYGTALNSTQLNASITTGDGELTYSPASGTVLVAGPHTLIVTAAETANYKVATKTVTLQVNKATPVIAWSNPATITYGTALSNTQLNADAGGVAGTFTYTPDLGTVLNAGNGQTLSVSFVPNDAANYNTPATKTVTIDVDKATATISLSGLTGQTYDGNAKRVTVATTPADLSGLSITYDGAAAAPVNAGPYAVVVFLTNDNYKAESQSGTLIINQATADVQVAGYTGTYDGNAHGATGTAKGVINEDLSSLLNFGNSFTDYPGGTASWSFAGNTNYKSASGDVAIVINKATPSITLTIGDAPTYDGNAHHVQSATVSGVGGASLGNAQVVYKQGATTVEHPTNAGSYSVIASYAGSTNYEAAEPQTGTFEIKKANAVVTVNSYTGTYDGKEHGATGEATGVGGVALGGLNLGAKFKNAPGGTTQWTFDGGTNYNDQNGNVAITILKADATINVTGYTGVYDGAVHGASGTVTGVEGETLTGLDLGASFTDVPGSTANWTFTDVTGNYNNKSGSVPINISKANQVITWANPANITYGTSLGNDQLNATALGGAVLTYTPSAGTVLGAGSRILSVNAAATNNYNAASKEVTLVVDKATATISLSDLNHVYDGTVKNAKATTIPSELSGLSISNNGKTDAGTYEVEATLSNDNYKAEPVKGNLFIDRATTSISMADVSGTTGGLATVTASISPALSGRTINFTLSGGSIGTAQTNTSGVATLSTPACINNATIEASFAGESNYKASAKTATLSTVAPNYNWTVNNSTNNAPIQLAGSGVTVTPVVNFAGVTLTNATFDWDNGKGSVPVPGTLTDKYAPGSFTYTTAGVYAPKLVGKDACGNTITIRLEYLVIYDPNGGFVTGGGWIYSPAGAYRAEPSADGKATFGFVAKYKKGSTSIVEGETEFQFHAGNLKFNSTAYDNVSLVVGGAKASYKGTGTINGAGSYKFMLTAIDGQVTGGGGQDKIRMKITDAAGEVVYDNMMDALDNATPTTALQGGSIVIHEAKATKSIDVSQTLQLNRLEATESSKFDLQAFPNPSAAQFNLKLESNITTEKITIRVVDMHGRTVQLLHNLVAGQTLQIGNDYRPGVYIVEMVQGNNRKQIKLLKQPN